MSIKSFFWRFRDSKIYRIIFDESATWLFALAALFVAIILFYVVEKPSTENIITEAWGFLFDIILFGVILTIYDQLTKRKRRIRELNDQFNDFRFWMDKEGVLRKVAIIRRLNAMKAELPSMINANLQGADLTGANFEGAVLSWANLQRADLNIANFQGAVLTDANFEGAMLLQANLQRADLNHANFQGANLQGANLERANLKGAKLLGTDLTEVQNLSNDQIKGAKWDANTKWPDYIDPEKIPKGDDAHK